MPTAGGAGAPFGTTGGTGAPFGTTGGASGPFGTTGGASGPFGATDGPAGDGTGQPDRYGTEAYWPEAGTPSVPSDNPAPSGVAGRATVRGSFAVPGTQPPPVGDSYQPGPAPGISPAGAVPLPPQEPRVPGAALGDVPSFAQQRQPGTPEPGQPQEQRSTPPAWAPGSPSPNAWGGAGTAPASAYPGSPASSGPVSGGGFPVSGPPTGSADVAGATAGPASVSPAPFGTPPLDQAAPPVQPLVPQPRTSSESVSGRVRVPSGPVGQPDEPDHHYPGPGGAEAAGTYSASASVPLASLAMPPADHSVHATAPPQPRVYGRPAAAPEQDAEHPTPEGGHPAGPSYPPSDDPRYAPADSHDRRVHDQYGHDRPAHDHSGHDRPSGGPGEQPYQEQRGFPGDEQAGFPGYQGYPPPGNAGFPPGNADFPSGNAGFPPGEGFASGGRDEPPQAPAFPPPGDAPFGMPRGGSPYPPPPNGVPFPAQRGESPFQPGDSDRPGHHPHDVSGRSAGSARVAPPVPASASGADLAPPLEQSRHFTRSGPGAPYGDLLTPGGPDGPPPAGPRGGADQPGFTQAMPAVAPPGVPPGYDQPGPGQPGGGSWPDGGDDGEQNRFEAFKPETAEEKTEPAPPPQVRNGRVLAMVLTAAVLILAIPLGTLWLLGKFGGEDVQPAGFNPAVGSCVKNDANKPVAAECGEAGAFKIISRVADVSGCPDPEGSHILLSTGPKESQVLCLQPATAG